MIHEFGALCLIFLQSALDIDFRQGIVSLYEEDPSVGIQIRGVVRFQLDTLGAHTLRLLQVFLLQGKEVTVVVQYDHVLVIVLQCLIVRFIRLIQLPHLVINITDLAVEIRFQRQVLLRDDIQARIIGIQGFLIFLLLVVSDTQIEVIFRRLGEKLHTSRTDTDDLRDILPFQSQIQQLLPSPGVTRFHLGYQLELEFRLLCLSLGHQETAIHQF